MPRDDKSHPKRRASKASLTPSTKQPAETNDATTAVTTSTRTGPRRSSRRVARPELSRPKKPPDPLPGRKQGNAKSTQKSPPQEGKGDPKRNVAQEGTKKHPAKKESKNRRATSRTRTMQPVGNRSQPRSAPGRGSRRPARTSISRKRQMPFSSGSSSDANSKEGNDDDDSDDSSDYENVKSMAARMKSQLESADEDSSHDSDEERQAKKYTKFKSGSSDSDDSDGDDGVGDDDDDGEGDDNRDEDEDEDEDKNKKNKKGGQIEESEEERGPEEGGKRRLSRNPRRSISRAALVKSKRGRTPTQAQRRAPSRSATQSKTRNVVKRLLSRSKKARHDDDSEGDISSEDRDSDNDDEDEDDEENDEFKDGSPQVRHSGRVRRPPAKIVDPGASSSSEESGDPKTPVISNFSKSRRRTQGRPIGKHRKKVLTEPPQRKKPATKTKKNQTSRRAASSRPRRSASAKTTRKITKVQQSESDTEGSVPDENLEHSSPSDVDDESMTTNEGPARDDASLLDSDDENPWYHSPETERRQRADEHAMLHQAHCLAYSWDDLHLGTHLGSAALNECLREELREVTVETGYARGRSVPQYTAQQCLSMIRSLRPMTVLPPPKSELHDVVRHYPNHERNSKGDGEEYMEVMVDMEEEEADPEAGDGQKKKSTTQFFYGPKIPYDSLARLYETMCQQDVDDGREAQRQAQFMTSEACIERFREMEEKVTELNLREQRVMEMAQIVGLMPRGSNASNVEVNRLLGLIPREVNHLSDEDDEDD